MKKGLYLFAVVLIVVLFAAGLSAKDAKAIVIPNTPEESCNFIISLIKSYGGSVHPGSGWKDEGGKCLLAYTLSGGSNICYPNFDVVKPVQIPSSPPDFRGGVSPSFYMMLVGCSSGGSLIKEPGNGIVDLGSGVTFEYENESCGNGCNVTKFGLTGAAKSALGVLNGKVKGKAYVQIRDDDGNLVEGDFKLCFAAKGAKNPYFFRFGGGNTWSPVGGYWQGNKFCMNGTISGNYVLADMP